ncbi:MAG: restriction endonuclease subunit S [Bulleidia sp.]|nr:restriction endonuclease subunit S [Bulleidia sp.]
MKYITIEDCCEILDSMRIPITACNRTDGKYPYYGANGIQDYINNYIFDDDLVLLAEDGGNFGSKEKPIAYRVSGKCWVNNHAHVLKPKKGINVDFLCYSLMFYDTSELVNGATRQKLTQAAMRKMRIPGIPEKEQIELVNILNVVQSTIKQYKTLINKCDNLVKARFVELFGDININDKGWNCESLGNLCTIVRGGSPRPIEQFLGGDVPWIKIGDATDGDNIYLSSTKEHIIQEGVKKSRLVKSGSLIFANCGVSLGFARIITFDGCIHDGWLAIEDIDERLDKVFLLQALNQMTEHFRKIAPAGTQPNLNTAIMKAYKQVIPPIELQKDFIRFAEQVDKSKLAVQQSLEKTQLLFDSLMQEYFGEN